MSTGHLIFYGYITAVCLIVIGAVVLNWMVGRR